jgi:NTE family protein
LASGSLPPGFPMTVIDGVPYWDGGLFDNTPIEVHPSRRRDNARFAGRQPGSTA